MVSLNDCKFVSNQLGKASIGCCPRSFGMSSLLFDCSDWVYIRLSNAFPLYEITPHFFRDFD